MMFDGNGAMRVEGNEPFANKVGKRIYGRF